MKTVSKHPSFRPSWTLFLIVLLPLPLSLAACTFNAERPGDGGTTPPTGPTPIAGLTSIRIDPANATVTLNLTKAPPTQKFDAYGTINGHEQKITDRVSWLSDRTIVATVDKNGLATVGTTGGIATVTARNGNIGGNAHLTVQLTGVFTAEGAGAMPALPANPGSKFNGTADTSRAPQLVYPNDKRAVPAQRVRRRGALPQGQRRRTRCSSCTSRARIGDFTIYTRCVTLADGCLYAPEPPGLDVHRRDQPRRRRRCS